MTCFKWFGKKTTLLNLNSEQGCVSACSILLVEMLGNRGELSLSSDVTLRVLGHLLHQLERVRSGDGGVWILVPPPWTKVDWSRADRCGVNKSIPAQNSKRSADRAGRCIDDFGMDFTESLFAVSIIPCWNRAHRRHDCKLAIRSGNVSQKKTPVPGLEQTFLVFQLVRPIPRKHPK